jgi:SgrR family transcriptional regulator
MRLANDYLQLRKSFSHVHEGLPFQVTMAELAQALFCTQRNVKIILTKMTNSNWVRFVPGRGRGHASELTFLAKKEEILMREAQERVRAGEVEKAFELVKQYGEGPLVKEQFLEWLSCYFGYQVEDHNDRYIETLKLPVYRPIHTLDPIEAFYAFDSHMIKQIFSTLVEYDYAAHTIVGGIAHHWEANKHATEWIFYLRKGVYFHHGREVTAQDAVYSLLRLRDISYAQGWLGKDIDRVEAVSRYVLRINLKKPNYLFLLFLSYVPASIVPRDVYEQAQGHVLPIGSGPYRVTKHTAGVCVLEAFDHHFQGRAFIDRIDIVIVPETGEDISDIPAANFLMVRTGEAVVRSIHEWQEAEDVCGSSLLTVNLQRSGILQNIYFRKALYHIINRQRMVVELGEPRLYPARGLQLTDRPHFFDKDWLVDEAVQLLCLSGYSGEAIRLFTYARHAPDAYWLKKEYVKYGINIEVNIVSWGDMLKKEKIDQADLILFEAVLSEGPIRQIEYYQSANSFIRSHLSEELSSVIDREIEELLAEPSDEGRRRKLHDIEKRVKEEYALVFLVYKNVSMMSHPSLQGVKVSPRGWVDFKDVWVQNERIKE